MNILKLKENILKQITTKTGIESFDTKTDYDIDDSRPTHCILNLRSTQYDNTFSSCNNSVLHNFSLIIHLDLSSDDINIVFDNYKNIFNALLPDIFYSNEYYKILDINNFSNIDYLGTNASTGQVAYIQTFDVMVIYYE